MEGRMNRNKIEISGWYPSNLVKPVKVNGDVFKREMILEKEVNFLEEEELQEKEKKIIKLNNEIKCIKTNPVTKLSAENDDFSFIGRLVPLYRSHFSKATLNS